MNKLTRTRVPALVFCWLFSLPTVLFSNSLYASENFSWEWDDSETEWYDPETLEQSPVQASRPHENKRNKVKVEQWQLMKDQYGIQLYLGTVKGTDVRAFKGVVRINASIDNLLAVMIDAQNCPDWVHDCEASYLVQDKGIRDRYVFQSYDLMFPAGKRDYLFYASVNQNPVTQSVSIHMEAAPGFCKNNPGPKCTSINQSNNIMIQESSGSYLLEPMSDGSTKVTWEQFTDPAGNLPVFIVNQLVLNVPFMTLKGLQDIVKEEKYQMAEDVLEKHFMLTGNIEE